MCACMVKNREGRCWAGEVSFQANHSRAEPLVLREELKDRRQPVSSGGGGCLPFDPFMQHRERCLSCLWPRFVMRLKWGGVHNSTLDRMSRKKA